MLDIDTRALIYYKLTAHQYIILYLLNTQQHNLLNAYLTSTDFKFFENDINYLMENKLIERYEYQPILDIKGYIVLPKALSILSSESSDYFDDFLVEFPTKVSRNGVTDYLKSDLTKSRRKYMMLTKGKKHIHEHILKCLIFEVNHRTTHGTMGYFKKLSNWIDTEEWKAYESALDNELDNKPKLGYGSKLE